MRIILKKMIFGGRRDMIHVTKKPASCESDVSYKQQLFGCLSCPTGNWTNLNSTCEVSTRTKWYKCTSSDEEHCFLKDFSSCNDKKNVTATETAKTNKVLNTTTAATGNRKTFNEKTIGLNGRKIQMKIILKKIFGGRRDMIHVTKNQLVVEVMFLTNNNYLAA